MLGALMPWLEREFLSQRNQHGGALPDSPLVDSKRVQLITATGTTIENGEELVWTEIADGQFWIHCCFPRDLVNQFDSSNARAKPFSSYSATKGLFRLLRYRFVLARPLIPPHASPRKQQHPQSSNKEQQQPRLRSLRICLRVEEFKLYSQGQGALLGDYQDFRKWCPVAAPEQQREGASGPLAMAAKARVEWVKRIECGEGSSFSKKEQTDEANSDAASKVEFLQDLQGASDPKPRVRKPSPPPDTAAGIDNAPLAAPLFPAIATIPNTNPPPPAPASSLLHQHRPIPSVRDGVPPYVPMASWPADVQPIVKIDWREGEERIRQRAMPPVVVETKTEEEEEEEKVVVPPERARDARDPPRLDKEEEQEVEMLLLGGTGSKPTSPTKESAVPAAVALETTEPIGVDWSSAAEKLQRRQQQPQQTEARAAVHSRPSKPPTTTMIPLAASPSRPSVGQRQSTAKSSPVVESRTDPTLTRFRGHTSPRQQPQQHVGADVEPGSGTAGEAATSAMREQYEDAWRLAQNGSDGLAAGFVENDSNGGIAAFDLAAPEPLTDAQLVAKPYTDTNRPALSQPESPRRPRPLSPGGADIAQEIPERQGSNSTTKAVAGRSAYAPVWQVSLSRPSWPAAGPSSAREVDTSASRRSHPSQEGDAAGSVYSRASAKEEAVPTLTGKEQSEEARRGAKRPRDELEQDQDALDRRRRQPQLGAIHFSPSCRPAGEGRDLFRSASPASPAGDDASRSNSTSNHWNGATREESILSQDLEQASPDPSDSDESCNNRTSRASSEPQEASANEDEEMEDPLSGVSGSERAPTNPHDAQSPFVDASQDDKLRFATSGATTAEAIPPSVSPDRLLPSRRDRAEAPIAAAVQDLGEVLIDSAQLVVSPSPSTVANSHGAPPNRPQKVTWRIKPELFDFGLWCRANEITA